MLGTRKLQKDRGQSASVIEQGDARYLVSDMKRNGLRERSVLRVVGNSLIALGLIMLLGIGGWYGYAEWSNAQYVEEVKQKYGETAFEPPVNAAPEPTEVPLPTPLPVLNTGKAIGIQKGEVGKQAQKAEDNSPPTRLYIPGVGIDSKVVPVGWRMIPKPGGGVKSEWDVADYAVGHHKNSANPGQAGNVVMSGHVDYKGQVFKELHKVNRGDEVIVYTEKGQYIYVVTDLKIVLEEGASDEQKRANAAFMNPTPDPTLTLITCWPYGIDTHRLIVIAKPYQSTMNSDGQFQLR